MFIKNKTFEIGSKVLNNKPLKNDQGIFTVNHQFTIHDIIDEYYSGHGRCYYFNLIDSDGNHARFVQPNDVSLID